MPASNLPAISVWPSISQNSEFKSPDQKYITGENPSTPLLHTITSFGLLSTTQKVMETLWLAECHMGAEILAEDVTLTPYSYNVRGF